MPCNDWMLTYSCHCWLGIVALVRIYVSQYLYPRQARSINPVGSSEYVNISLAHLTASSLGQAQDSLTQSQATMSGKYISFWLSCGRELWARAVFCSA